MITATEEATTIRDAIKIRVEKRVTLNFKGAKAQKAYVHVHGGETYRIQSRGCTVAEFAANFMDALKAIGVSVEIPKHLAQIAATKILPLSDQALHEGDVFVWAVQVPEEKDDAVKAAADAAKHAAADGPPLLIFSDDLLDSGEPLVILEFDPTGE